MKQRFTLLLVTLIAVLVLAACGGESAPEPKTVDYNFTSEFVYSPDSIVAQTGQEITVNLNNADSALSHSWVLIKESVDEAASAEEIEAVAYNAAANSGEIAAGESDSITFTAPEEPGVYEFVCSIAGHLQGGMVGKLTVTE